MAACVMGMGVMMPGAGLRSTAALSRRGASGVSARVAAGHPPSHGAFAVAVPVRCVGTDVQRMGWGSVGDGGGGAAAKAAPAGLGLVVGLRGRVRVRLHRLGGALLEQQQRRGHATTPGAASGGGDDSSKNTASTSAAGEGDGDNNKDTETSSDAAAAKDAAAAAADKVIGVEVPPPGGGNADGPEDEKPQQTNANKAPQRSLRNFLQYFIALIQPARLLLIGLQGAMFFFAITVISAQLARSTVHVHPVTYSRFLTVVKNDDISALSVDGVYLKWTPKAPFVIERSGAGPMGVTEERMEVEYSAARPDDAKVPYDVLHKNKVDFSAVDQRAASQQNFYGFLAVVVIFSLWTKLSQQGLTSVLFSA